MKSTSSQGRGSTIRERRSHTVTEASADPTGPWACDGSCALYVHHKQMQMRASWQKGRYPGQDSSLKWGQCPEGKAALTHQYPVLQAARGVSATVLRRDFQGQHSSQDHTITEPMASLWALMWDIINAAIKIPLLITSESEEFLQLLSLTVKLELC